MPERMPPERLESEILMTKPMTPEPIMPESMMPEPLVTEPVAEPLVMQTRTPRADLHVKTALCLGGLRQRGYRQHEPGRQTGQ